MDLQVMCHELCEGIIFTGAGQNEKSREKLNQDNWYTARYNLNIF
jgi:hypothetical protein